MPVRCTMTPSVTQQIRRSQDLLNRHQRAREFILSPPTFMLRDKESFPMISGKRKQAAASTADFVCFTRSSVLMPGNSRAGDGTLPPLPAISITVDQYSIGLLGSACGQSACQLQVDRR